MCPCVTQSHLFLLPSFRITVPSQKYSSHLFPPLPLGPSFFLFLFLSRQISRLDLILRTLPWLQTFSEYPPLLVPPFHQISSVHVFSCRSESEVWLACNSLLFSSPETGCPPGESMYPVLVCLIWPKLFFPLFLVSFQFKILYASCFSDTHISWNDPFSLFSFSEPPFLREGN